jgi:hypothetical protein
MLSFNYRHFKTRTGVVRWPIARRGERQRSAGRVGCRTLFRRRRFSAYVVFIPCRTFSAAASQHVLDFLDRIRRLPAMNDRMSVWATWPQVLDWVQLVLRSYLGDWDDMVHVNVSDRCLAIVCLEVETTAAQLLP